MISFIWLEDHERKHGRDRVKKNMNLADDLILCFAYNFPVVQVQKR